MSYFLARLKEPSTWAGLSAFAMLFGIDPGKISAVASAGAALGAAVAVFKPDVK